MILRFQFIITHRKLHHLRIRITFSILSFCGSFVSGDRVKSKSLNSVSRSPYIISNDSSGSPVYLSTILSYREYEASVRPRCIIDPKRIRFGRNQPEIHPPHMPEAMHEYNLTPHSLYAAVSVGLETKTIVYVLNKLSKTKLPARMIDFIRASMANYGKVKLVLKKNRYFVESPFPEVLKKMLRDEVIARARITYEGLGVDGFSVSKGLNELESGQHGLLDEAELAAAEEIESHSFEIDPAKVENVKERCLPANPNYPMLEEYDFRNDTVNPDLDMELKPHAQPRPYQEKSLSKMF